MIPVKETKYKKREQIECPTCKVKGCFEHCNHCGIPIKWKDEQGDPRYDTNKEGRRIRVVFENDGSIHRCMSRGTKDGNYYNVKREKVYYKLEDDIGTNREGQVYSYYPLTPEEQKQWNVDKKKWDYSQQHYFCGDCAREYNRLAYTQCPSCWKNVCRKCDNHQAFRYGESIAINTCFACGHDRLDPRQVWTAYERLYGKRTW